VAGQGGELSQPRLDTPSVQPGLFSHICSPTLGSKQISLQACHTAPRVMGWQAYNLSRMTKPSLSYMLDMCNNKLNLQHITAVLVKHTERHSTSKDHTNVQ